MAIVYHENRVRVRISSACNSKCLMCLDSDQIKLNKFIPEKIVKEQIKKNFKPGMKNKIIISGGEASINPKFFEYINYAKKIGYKKIQTVTNGLLWADINFCKKAVNAGLTEITFSIHGYNSQTHDYITQIPGSFKKIIKAILNFKKYFPHIIVNADIVISKININYAYKTIQLLKKLDIREYDILQVIPFGRARTNKDIILFNNIFNYYDKWQLIWKESEDKRVHMWANRVFPQLLEGYEHMIQSPEKIRDETMGEGKKIFETVRSQKKKPNCADPLRCKNCYLKRYYNEMGKSFTYNKKYENNTETYKLKSNGDILRINQNYPETKEEFIKLIREESKKYKKVINIPYCIVNKNNKFTHFNYDGKSIEEFTTWFINEGFRIKGLNCKNCKFYNKCEGIHINFIKKYGFDILKPIYK